jgi:arsenate reductase
MPTTIITSTENFFKTAYKKLKMDNERKELLHTIANTIAKELKEKKEVNLNFICTHNSRRSQIAQTWSFFAADYFDLNINSFSGGTEVTAFYRNSVKTLQKVGFSFNLLDFSHQNPKYEISFEGSKKSITGFSKRYDDVENQDPFIAITTCNSADSKCPFIPSALHRFHLPFTDPKFSDGSSTSDVEYLKTNTQIAGEIFMIFSKIKEIV